jgi:hypothetical protein
MSVGSEWDSQARPCGISQPRDGDRCGDMFGFKATPFTDSQIAQSLPRPWARVATFYDLPDILKPVTKLFKNLHAWFHTLTAIRRSDFKPLLLALSQKGSSKNPRYDEIDFGIQEFCGK